jgi:RimJ/RimL family protein N-acetyltransferase
MLTERVHPLTTERFFLRCLTSNDVNDSYLSWFGDVDVRKYIEYAAKQPDKDSLNSYINERAGRTDVIFWGIFERVSGAHIGNIKYEPINSSKGVATMGILIGDAKWRSKGVAREVIYHTGQWLNRNYNVEKIILGVHGNNYAALAAYKKIGFQIENMNQNASPGVNIEMSYDIRQRIKT